MKNQVVVINFTAMMYTCIMYIVLVFCVWLLIRLTIACFKLPSMLNAANEAEMERDKLLDVYKKNIVTIENQNNDERLTQEQHEKSS
ncbi:uncharacterized protein LOC126838821 [Adelges cooleyi]|uniref:uncharacterized protein LOC126838821 n=1 Tax=Adelges cooleyi TaxID=133065 RepID=UPI00217F9C47|nr:uncharacterized protein LOC126838821 [Adelges cooleyi]